jgi:hypothetical protein
VGRDRQNPVVLLDLTSNVAAGAPARTCCSRPRTSRRQRIPRSRPDFILANRIPDSYLPAGSLTFEDDFGTIYWRLSWGGAGYTGATTGA